MKVSRIIGKIAKVGVFVGSIAAVACYNKKKLDKSEELQGRYKAYYKLANQWLINKNEGKSVATYLVDKNINTVAVYGIGTLGEIFYNDLKETDVKVAYFIDKNAGELCYGLDDIAVVGLDDIAGQDKVDAIVVTPIFDFDEIEKTLEEATDVQLISLEDLVRGI